jgi:hypothetical protein
MVFKPPSDSLYREQREKLEALPVDDRMEYEELAAYIEYDCGVLRAHAEREAYSKFQTLKGWHVQRHYPDFSALRR